MNGIKRRSTAAEAEGHKITETVRRRLPAYYRALITLYAMGEEKVSSKQLAAVIGSAESQVRTDMLAIGCKGQKGYGYNIARLYKRIGEVMSLCDVYSAVIVGEGALADAAAESQLFTKRGIKLLRRFTSEEALCSNNTPSLLDDFCRGNAVDIFILACKGQTGAVCLETAERLGIKGILNLSETDLYSKKITVRNIHIDDALMMLCSEIPKPSADI